MATTPEDDHAQDAERDEVTDADAQDLAEQEAEQVADVVGDQAEQEDARGEHPGEQHADGRVAAELSPPGHPADGERRRDRGDRRADVEGALEQVGGHHAGERRVAEGVAHERQAAQHHVAADDRADEAHQGRRGQGAHEERERERVEDRVEAGHHALALVVEVPLGPAGRVVVMGVVEQDRPLAEHQQVTAVGPREDVGVADQVDVPAGDDPAVDRHDLLEVAADRGQVVGRRDDRPPGLGLDGRGAPSGPPRSGRRRRSRARRGGTARVRRRWPGPGTRAGAGRPTAGRSAFGIRRSCRPVRGPPSPRRDPSADGWRSGPSRAKRPIIATFQTVIGKDQSTSSACGT